MARPRSEDKRKAILDAALHIVAERGIANARTSAISEVAGVAEGSLFTYFNSKEELMEELYQQLRGEFSRNLADFPRQADARTRMRHIWDMYLDLGATHPENLKVLAQLRTSGKLYKENETPTLAIIEVMRAAREAVSGNELRDSPPEYMVLVARAHAEITVEFVHAHPEYAEVCRELGFKMLWKSLTGE